MAECGFTFGYQFHPRKASISADLIDQDHDSSSSSEGEDMEERIHKPCQEWCQCDNCRIGAPKCSAKDCICCQEWPRDGKESMLIDLLMECERDCILTHPDFYLIVLTQAILRVTFAGIHIFKNKSGKVPKFLTNRYVLIL